MRIETTDRSALPSTGRKLAQALGVVKVYGRPITKAKQAEIEHAVAALDETEGTLLRR